MTAALRHAAGRGAVAAAALFILVLATQFLFGPVATIGLTSDQRRVVADAEARFEEAGLRLPNVVVRRGGIGDCDGRGYTVNTWPIKVVTLCVVSEEVVVHELAHAWTYAHLDRGERQAWTERRGAATWSEKTYPWPERSAEHAADILTWYLYWSHRKYGPVRISGDHRTYVSDLAWLMGAAEGHRGVDHLNARAEDLENLLAAAGP